MTNEASSQPHCATDVLSSVREWVSTMVIGLNLCPFAKAELLQERIHFVVSPATTAEKLLLCLAEQVQHLDGNPGVATTLLIHPYTLQHFLDYNDFLEQAETLLAQMGREGVYQIASFHPQYQFADTLPADAENFTNRSPYPLLHLLREDDVERAVAAHPDIGAIPLRNIDHMQTLGFNTLQQMLDGCSSLNPRA